MRRLLNCPGENWGGLCIRARGLGLGKSRMLVGRMERCVRALWMIGGVGPLMVIPMDRLGRSDGVVLVLLGLGR